MSKSLSGSVSAFRKIDVDQYNEDYYKDDEGTEVSSVTGPDEAEVTNLLNQGKNIDALKVVFRSAPLGSKNQTVKNSALSLVMKVLMSFKPSDIDKAVGALDSEMLDTLMKYVYRGFEIPSEGLCFWWTWKYHACTYRS
ncbi:actin-related protein 2/3 complex subunit 5-like isoform X2 [Limulus polyphemus]|uniref:Actin-related protein 2/3 complex subunit 5 n=1 Tax=Limulus polyphemus TaxID=6850 RepID=A0ABM1STX6_LIMPO|nr:actin-related protein 2/3 complex subunit 5-like isoform X2 [Limulus polyphemus]